MIELRVSAKPHDSVHVHIISESRAGVRTGHGHLHFPAAWWRQIAPRFAASFAGLDGVRVTDGGGQVSVPRYRERPGPQRPIHQP